MKPFPAPFFNHFTHPIPPPIAKLKYVHGVSLRVSLLITVFDIYSTPRSPGAS